MQQPKLTFEFNTQRLWLRPCQAGDLEALYHLWNDAAVRRYFWDGNWISRFEVQEAIAASGCSFSRWGVGQWAIFLRGDRSFIGSAGLITATDPFFDHDVFAAGDDLIELMYALLPVYRDQGFTTEAVAAIIEHASRVVERRRVVATVEVANAASVRVLDKSGFKYERRQRVGSEQIDIYRLTG